MGLLKFVARRTVELVLIVLLLLYLPRIPPNAKISEPYSVTPARPFEGPLRLNEKLNDVELWHEGDLLGPEAFADFRGELYTTLHGGDVVKLTGNHITPVAKFGKPCRGYHEERICGRPLGMAFDKAGKLYVADAYYGIFKFDVTTGEKKRLVAVDDIIDGRNVTLPNSVAVAGNGDIYWTDSSTEFSLEDGIFDMLADGSGRLIHYDAKTGKNTILVSGLHFANGVVLSEDESFVLVAETARNRIHRYYLRGPRRGTRDVFIDGLPGMTDNLKADGRGGFIVPLVIGVDADHPGFTQIFGPFPLIRRLLARLLGVIEFGFKLVNEIYPNQVADKGVHAVGHFTTFSFLNPKRVTVLHLSKDGEILDSIHCLNKKMTGISEAHVFKDTLYFGSPFNDYIGRIPLAKIGWEHLKQAPKPTASPKTTPSPPKTTPPPPKTTTPPPKTTTPPPKTTTPPPKTTTPPPKPATLPPKPTTPPPPPPSKVTTPPVVKPTTPPPKTTTPPSKPTTPPPPPPSKVTTPPKTPPSKPTTPPPPPSKPSTPPPTPKPTTSIPASKPTSTPPPPKPTTTSPKPTEAPTTTPSPAKAQPVKDQPKPVPVKESPPKAKN